MAPLAYYALVAAIILVLIFVVLSIAKKVMGVGMGSKVKSRGPRLAVMDVSVIDPKRKLVLVRRDEVEHLLLIGGQNDLVVEASILRVASGARPGRTEPTLQPEADFATGGGLRTQAPRGAATPGPVARSPSPLTRPVPRPTAPAPAPAPVAERTMSPVVEPAVDAAPVVDAPVVAPPTSPRTALSATGRIEPGLSSPRGGRSDAPAVELSTDDLTRPEGPAQPEPSNDGDLRPAPAAAPLVAPTPAAMPVVAPVVAPVIAAAPAAAAPIVQPPKPAEAPLPRPTPAAVRMPVERSISPLPGGREITSSIDAPSATAAAPSVDPASGPLQPLSASLLVTPVSTDTPRPTISLPAQFQRPIPRDSDLRDAVRVTATMPTMETPALAPASTAPSVSTPNPVPAGPQRPPSSLAPTTIQPRSMATPTLPVKPAPLGSGPEITARSSDPAGADETTAARRGVEPPNENMSSAEPSPEAVLARLLGTADAANAPIVEDKTTVAEPRLSSSRIDPVSAAPSRAPQDVPTIDPGDRRPLSVRSFASVIQGRQSSGDQPAAAVTPTPPRVEPAIGVPAMGVPAVPPVSSEPPVISRPASGGQLVKPVTATAHPLPSVQPATSWEDEEEEDLGDFLSAQLDDELGGDIWNSKEAPVAGAAAASKTTSAPVVRPPEASAQPAPPPPSSPVEPIPVAAPVAAKADPLLSAPPPRRQLTLEEEMERLLGDFDIETADRRVR
ncbi:hypothetical protein ASG43_18740 [Aureimonas sp. Leaf454]|nr:hypothetical protein ASG43_18740 [Aureimonas sp. Leaf454]